MTSLMSTLCEIKREDRDRKELLRQRLSSIECLSNAELCMKTHLKHVTKYHGECQLCSDNTIHDKPCYRSKDFFKIETELKELTTAGRLSNIEMLCEFCAVKIVTSTEPDNIISIIRTIKHDRRAMMREILYEDRSDTETEAAQTAGSDLSQSSTI